MDCTEAIPHLMDRELPTAVQEHVAACDLCRAIQTRYLGVADRLSTATKMQPRELAAGARLERLVRTLERTNWTGRITPGRSVSPQSPPKRSSGGTGLIVVAVLVVAGAAVAGLLHVVESDSTRTSGSEPTAAPARPDVRPVPDAAEDDANFVVPLDSLAVTGLPAVGPAHRALVRAARRASRFVRTSPGLEQRLAGMPSLRLDVVVCDLRCSPMLNGKLRRQSAVVIGFDERCLSERLVRSLSDRSQREALGAMFRDRANESERRETASLFGYGAVFRDDPAIQRATLRVPCGDPERCRDSHVVVYLAELFNRDDPQTRYWTVGALTNAISEAVVEFLRSGATCAGPR